MSVVYLLKSCIYYYYHGVSVIWKILKIKVLMRKTEGLMKWPIIYFRHIIVLSCVTGKRNGVTWGRRSHCRIGELVYINNWIYGNRFTMTPHKYLRTPSYCGILFWPGGCPRQLSCPKKFKALVVPGGGCRKGVILQGILTPTGVLQNGMSILIKKGM